MFVYLSSKIDTIHEEIVIKREQKCNTDKNFARKYTSAVSQLSKSQ